MFRLKSITAVNNSASKQKPKEAVTATDSPELFGLAELKCVKMASELLATCTHHVCVLHNAKEQRHGFSSSDPSGTMSALVFLHSVRHKHA